MSWYRIEADYGPGHQSHSGEYQWFDRKLTRAEKQEVFEETFKGHDWPVGSVSVVSKLPKKVVEEKILQYKRTIEQATKMLTVLGG